MFSKYISNRREEGDVAGWEKRRVELFREKKRKKEKAKLKRAVTLKSGVHFVGSTIHFTVARYQGLSI